MPQNSIPESVSVPLRRFRGAEMWVPQMGLLVIQGQDIFFRLYAALFLSLSTEAPMVVTGTHTHRTPVEICASSGSFGFASRRRGSAGEMSTIGLTFFLPLFLHILSHPVLVDDFVSDAFFNIFCLGIMWSRGSSVRSDGYWVPSRAHISVSHFAHIEMNRFSVKCHQ